MTGKVSPAKGAEQGTAAAGTDRGPGPTADDSRPHPRDHLVLLEARSYRTYQSRLRASQRLASRSHAWNAFLMALSTSTVIASIALLSDPTIYGKSGPTLLVCVSLLTLVASLVTSGLDYSGRSRDMFLNYRRIQRLSAEAERAKDVPEKQTSAYVEDLNSQYDALLDESENHTQADHYRAFPEGQRSWPVWRWRDSVLSVAPYASLVLPVVLLIPFVHWMLS